jgi:hypothetical protein
MGPQILKRFYSCTIESILTSCITAWYGNCLASDRKAQQRVVSTAQCITRSKLPAIQDLYTRRCQRVVSMAQCITGSKLPAIQELYTRRCQRVVSTAQCITGSKLPAIQDLYTRRCQRKALKIVKDSSHPSHRWFSVVLHGKQYRSAKSMSKRLLNSFYPQAIRLLNS